MAGAELDLHVHRFGAGPVPVLAFHCAMASGKAWQRLAATLPEVTLTAPDLPGHGLSPELPAGGDPQGVTARAGARLLADAPAHIIGHSFGATVALRLALEHPERVRSLCLIEPVLFAALRGGPVWQKLKEIQKPFQDAFAAGNRMEAARRFHGQWGGGTAFDDLPEKLRISWADRIHLILQQQPALHDDIAGLLAPGRLESLPMHVLLLHGADSPAPIRAIEDVLAARIPAPRRVAVPEAGHMVALSHVPEVAAALRALWAGARAPEASSLNAPCQKRP